MADDRKPNGQFAKGTSGNPAGARPKRREKASVPASLRRMIFEVMDRIVEVKHSDGTIEKMPLYQANVLALATRGARGDRASARGVLEVVAQAAETDLMRSLAVQRHLNIHEELAIDYVRLKEKYEPDFRGGVLVVDPDAPEFRDGRLDDEESLKGAFPDDPRHQE